MKAWQLIEAHQPIRLNDVEPPTAGPGQVVVDVRAAGICHSDVGYLDGTLTRFLGFKPITLGHEIAGTIASVGEGVSNFSVGQRVAGAARPSGPGTLTDGWIRASGHGSGQTAGAAAGDGSVGTGCTGR